MRKLNLFILLFTVSLGLTANAQSLSNPQLSNIESIELFDGSKINVQTEVATIEFNTDRENRIDFVELKEGSIIDSYDVDKLVLKKGATILLDGNILNSDRFGKGLFKAAGDGSGG